MSMDSYVRVEDTADWPEKLKAIFERSLLR